MADLTFGGTLCSKPGGNKGPEEEDDEVFGLGLRRRLKLFDVEIGWGDGE